MDPSPVERHAAETLAKYIGLASNRKLAVVKSAFPVKGGICVGPELAAKGLGALPALTEEESLGRSRDDMLFLTGAGKSSRGRFTPRTSFWNGNWACGFTPPSRKRSRTGKNWI